MSSVMPMSSVSDYEMNPRLPHNVQLSISLTDTVTCTVRNNLQQVRFHALFQRPKQSKVQTMKFRAFPVSRIGFVLCGLLIWLATHGLVVAEAPPAAVSAFKSYIGTVESRLAQQHRTQNGFIAPVEIGEEAEMRLRGGELIIEKQTPTAGAELSG